MSNDKVWVTVIDLFNYLGYFYSSSSSSLLPRGAPLYTIHTVSELTPRNATGNYE